MHKAEPLVLQPISFEVEIAAEKLKWYKSAGINQSPRELFLSGRSTLGSEMHKLINPVWNKF